MFKKTLAVALVALFASQNLLAAPRGGEEADDGAMSPLTGPSLHLALGIRSKKAPDLDTYYSTVGGLKLSLLNLQAGNAMYFSFIAPGLQYAGYGIFAPSLTPIIINHNFGLGFGVDFFPVRSDRNGGPVGLSLNLDVVRVVSAVSNMAR